MQRKVKLIIISLIWIISLGGCGSSEKAYNTQKVVTVGKEQIYLDEMMYHVMIAEFQGSVIGSYYGNQSNYWQSEYAPGITMSEAMKDKVMEDAIKYEVLYQEAIKQNMTLTDEEEELVQDTVENLKRNIPNEQVIATQLTTEDIIEIQKKIVIATKYYRKILEDLGIDDDTIKREIDANDYKEYKIQYLFVPTLVHTNQKAQGSNANKAMTYKEMAYALIEKHLKQAKESDDFNKLDIKEDEENGLSVGEISFTMKEQPFGEEVEILNEVLKLKVDEVSDIFETCKGYYIIRRVKNNTTRKYDEAVKALKEERQKTVFDPYYNELKNTYNIKVNKSVWKKVKIGSMTIKSDS